ncbi:MAG: glycosyltransferase [Lentisphaeria bacterium]
MEKPQKTELEQLDFFQRTHERAEQAVAAAGEQAFFYRLADTRICLRFAGPALVRWLTPALAHLRVPEDAAAPPDLTLCLWDSQSTGVAMLPPPCHRDCFTDRGDIWGFNSRRIKTAFHWIESSVNLLDLETRRGVFWVQEADQLPFWVHASPLRTLLHWWMEANGCQLLHAAAVGTGDGAVLITGKGGVGKSTTALSCLQAGFRYLGDDYVVARLGPAPSVLSLYSSAKLEAGHVASFPALAPLIDNAGKLDREKAVLFLQASRGGQIVRELPLKAILTPQITGRPATTLGPVSRGELQRAMSFTTLSQLPCVGRHTHDNLNRLIDALPHGRLELGTDLPRIPDTVADLLAGRAAIPAAVPPAGTAPASGHPLVSVIIPVFNGQKFLREAVDNILQQGYPALEIIIVDDGSTDGTAAVVRQLPVDVRYFHQGNCGPATARNRGIRDASGEFIAFLDVDDQWPEHNLFRLTAELGGDPSVQVVRGYAQLMQLNPQTGEYDFAGNPKESFPHYIGAALYRKSIFEQVGLFDPLLRFGEDSDWFIRAAEQHVNVRRLEETTLHVRRHGGNMTEGRNLVELNAMKVFKKAVDRMRARNAAAPPANA